VMRSLVFMLLGRRSVENGSRRECDGPGGVPATAKLASRE
jgi:hypothetical protein